MTITTIQMNAQRSYQPSGVDTVAEVSTGPLQAAINTVHGHLAFAVEYLLPSELQTATINSVLFSIYNGNGLTDGGFCRILISCPEGTQNLAATDVYSGALRENGKTILNDAAAAPYLGGADYTAAEVFDIDVDLTTLFQNMQSAGAFSGNNVVVVGRVVTNLPVGYGSGYGGGEYGIFLQGIDYPEYITLVVDYESPSGVSSPKLLNGSRFNTSKFNKRKIQ